MPSNASAFKQIERKEKTTMKKIVALALVLVTLLTFTACKSEEERAAEALIDAFEDMM